LDLSKVIKNREVRKERHAQPFLNFFEGVEQCIAAGQDIIENRETSGHLRLLERSVVITFVTHVEIYFRDMLDAIFRQCDPDFFVPKLKHIHQNKYGIEEILELYKQQINPLELVSGEISFQNTEKFEKVFSKFLGGSLWGEAINIQVRIADKPETACSFEPGHLEGLKRVFGLRHELVHNPSNAPHLTTELLEDIENARGLIFAVDVVLCKMLIDHRDPALDVDD